MTHRDPNVFLPNDVARCAPSKPCGMTHRCARYLAPIVQGSPVADFSVPSASAPIWAVLVHVCTDRISLADARRPTPLSNKKVHPPVKGLS